MRKFFTIFILSLLSLILFSDYSFGFGWRRCGRPFVSSCRPVVPVHRHIVNKPIIEIKKEIIIEQVPIATPVLVPAFQFQYQQQSYSSVIPSPINNSGYVPNANYGNQGHNNNMMNNRDAIRELAKALLEEMQRLSQRQELNDGPPVVTGPWTGSSSNPPPVNSNNEMAAYNAFKRNCAHCHTGAGSKADAIIFTQPGLLNLHAPWEDMTRRLIRRQMPPKDSQYKPTDAEYDAMIQYAKSMAASN